MLGTNNTLMFVLLPALCVHARPGVRRGGTRGVKTHRKCVAVAYSMCVSSCLLVPVVQPVLPAGHTQTQCVSGTFNKPVTLAVWSVHLRADL